MDSCTLPFAIVLLALPCERALRKRHLSLYLRLIFQKICHYYVRRCQIYVCFDDTNVVNATKREGVRTMGSLGPNDLY